MADNGGLTMSGISLQQCDESMKTVLKNSKLVLTMFEREREYYYKKFQEVLTLTKKIQELTDLKEKQEGKLKLLEKRLEEIESRISRTNNKLESFAILLLLFSGFLAYITTRDLESWIVYFIIISLPLGILAEIKLLKPLKREKEDLKNKIDALKPSIESTKGEITNYKRKIISFRYELLASLKEISDNPEDALENLERFLQEPLKYLACELWLEVADVTPIPAEKLVERVYTIKHSVIFDHEFMRVLIPAVLHAMDKNEARISSVLKSYSHQINLFEEWSKITKIAYLQDVNKIAEIKSRVQSLKNIYVPEEPVEFLLSLLDVLYEGSVKVPVIDSNKFKLERALESTKPQDLQVAEEQHPIPQKEISDYAIELIFEQSGAISEGVWSKIPLRICSHSNVPIKARLILDGDVEYKCKKFEIPPGGETVVDLFVKPAAKGDLPVEIRIVDEAGDVLLEELLQLTCKEV